MVHEPTTSTFIVTGIVAAVLGPVLGPYALIMFAAVVGSLLAMSKTPQATRLAGLKFIAIGVLVALTITGAVIWAVERYTEIPGNVALMPVAFIIGAARLYLLTFIERCLDAFAAGLGFLLNRRAGK